MQHFDDPIGGESREQNHLLHLLVKLARALKHEIHELKEKMNMLTAEVQSLVDAVAANNAAIGDAVVEITNVEGKVADLSKQVADLQAQLAAGTPVDAEDLAAIVQATTDLSTGVASLKGAMPAPVVTPPPAPAPEPAPTA